MRKVRSPVAIYEAQLVGGGSGINALKLASWFREDGHDVDLVVHNCSEELRSRVPNGVRVIKLKQSSEPFTRLHMLYASLDSADLFCRSMFVSRNKLDYLLYLPSLRRYLRRSRPIVLFSSLWQPAITSLCARALVDPGLPIVCIFRSAYFNECERRMSRSKRPRKWRRFLEYCQRIYSQANVIVSVSQGIADDLTNIVGVSGPRMQIIHNPVVKTKDDTSPISTKSAPAEDRVIVAVGRLSPEKNFADLIRAFARIRHANRLKLRILGEGRERQALEALRDSLNLRLQVELPGWVDDPLHHLHGAGVFVSTSRWEGFGNSIVEALACGCPVVAYDCPHGPREILDGGRYGRLVPLDDIDALAAAIQIALDEPVDAAMLQRRAQDFSEDISAARYRNLLADLVHSSA